MAKTALFDITEGNHVKGPASLAVYIMEKGSVAETVASKTDDPFAFGRGFEDVEESYLSLPLSMLDMRVLELPFSEEESIREVLPYELDPIVLGGSGKIVFDARVLGRTNGKFKVLAVYVPKDTLRAVLDRLKSLGADPKAVTSLELASLSSSLSDATTIAEAIINPKPLSEAERAEAAISEAETPFVNLRRGELAYTKDVERVKKSLRLTAILALLTALVFASGLGFSVLSGRKEAASLRAEIGKTYEAVFPGERKAADPVYQMRAKLKELKDKEAAYSGARPLELLLDLSRLKKPGVAFTEVTVDRERIILKGESPSLSEVQALKTELEKALIEPAISDTKPSDAKTIFTITAKGRRP